MVLVNVMSNIANIECAATVGDEYDTTLSICAGVFVLILLIGWSNEPLLV